jgi:hypothetical protein
MRYEISSFSLIYFLLPQIKKMIFKIFKFKFPAESADPQIIKIKSFLPARSADLPKKND